MNDSKYRSRDSSVYNLQKAAANVSRVLPPAPVQKMALPHIWSQWFAGAAWHDFEHNGYLCEMSLTY